MRFPLTALTTAAVVALSACGSEETTTTVGDAEVTVSRDTAESDVDQLRDVIEQISRQAGVTDEIVDCYTEEVSNIPDAELQRLLDLSADLTASEVQVEMVPLLKDLQKACVPNKGPTLNADLTQNEIDLVREGTIRQIEAVLRDKGLSEQKTQCIVDQVEELSDHEIIDLSNAPIREVNQKYFEFGRACR